MLQVHTLRKVMCPLCMRMEGMHHTCSRHAEQTLFEGVEIHAPEFSALRAFRTADHADREILLPSSHRLCISYHLPPTYRLRDIVFVSVLRSSHDIALSAINANADGCEPK